MCSPDFPPVQLWGFLHWASLAGGDRSRAVSSQRSRFRLRRRIAMDRRGVFPSNMEVLPATDEASTSQS